MRKCCVSVRSVLLLVRSGSSAERRAVPPFELERNSKPVTTNGLPRRREVTARQSSQAPVESYIPLAVLAAACVSALLVVHRNPSAGAARAGARGVLRSPWLSQGARPASASAIPPRRCAGRRRGGSERGLGRRDADDLAAASRGGRHAPVGYVDRAVARGEAVRRRQRAVFLSRGVGDDRDRVRAVRRNLYYGPRSFDGREPIFFKELFHPERRELGRVELPAGT